MHYKYFLTKWRTALPVLTGLLLAMLFSTATDAQQRDITQTVRGRVIDGESKLPLPAAVVALLRDSMPLKVSHTDESGSFRMEEVPVGRYRLVVQMLGYEKGGMAELNVNSAKEVVLEIQMNEVPMKTQEVVITAPGNAKGNSRNEMALVSARNFTVEETERYAGSRGDPARMASNFAGVRGSDDTQNGVVVRGNSPFSSLWRMEGINIPNPNHFSSMGRTYGPASMINNKYLANSDFYAGAFPAEFGNSIGSVFDLRMRNGNNEKYEYSAQFGLLGTELFGEGPISKERKSSFIASYRYSTVSIFQKIGLDIGTDAHPSYQDAGFKLNFPGKKNSDFSIFGFGGMSSLVEKQSEKKTTSGASIYQTIPEDENYKGMTGLLGTSYAKTINPNTYLKITLAASTEQSRNTLFEIFRHNPEGTNQLIVDSIKPERTYRNTQSILSLSSFLNLKLSSRSKMKIGLIADQYFFNFNDSDYLLYKGEFRKVLDYKGTTMLIQPYGQWRYSISKQWLMTLGLHAQYLTLNGSASIEPRAALRWTINEAQSLSLGLGEHSQMLPTVVYFRQSLGADGQYHRNNQDIGFLRSRHIALAYDYAFRKDMRMKIEPYFQYLYNIPVNAKPGSYSVLNEGMDYVMGYPDRLANKGTGRNYGIEFTLEKFFSHDYMFLFTSSLYDSRYTASDGKEYNTAFNGLYAVNALAAKEIKWGDKNRNTFTIGGKVTVAGGLRSSPVDLDSSRKAGYTVFKESELNTVKLKDYFRADLKFAYKVNAKKVSHEAGVDFVNVFNTKNVLRVSYVPGASGPVTTNQLGFLPIAYYKLDF